MSLTDIQKYLFYKLVRSCIKRKKPIGSKLLAKKLKNKLSPPSLRIYLRKIAQNGYLENVGSGRLPTDKGWYYYLENFKLKPEINLPQNFDLTLWAELTKNIVFLFEDNLVIKGLKNVINFREKEIVEDLLNLCENLETIIKNLRNEFNILIGRDLPQSKTKKLSLIAYKDKKRVIGFLGHKINYYHTSLALLKKLTDNERGKITN
ncbi:MAG: hypothetical protein KatS3mg096_078 [Candidatus Parcubacteria bacterium]|nr:MAG: hypothetical protein KatS3mg096_078 [Candidatus Parcubacteria bacterium]